MRLTKITLAAAVVAAGAAVADTVASEDVVIDEYGAIEMSLTGVAGDPANGEKVMTTRGKGNCVACHQTTALDYAPFHGEVGPSLDGVGSRWNEAELRGLVAFAKKTFEGTVMPNFYQTSGFNRLGDAFTGKAGQEPTAPLLTAQEIEDVVAFLMTLTDE
jgi:sulfur-oxidizing protein SoxX